MRSLIYLTLAAITALPLPALGYDLIIRNGRIVDGTGNPAYHADLAIDQDRIVFIGKLPADTLADSELDAAGAIVAPGFIDVHTHAENLEKLPEAASFLRMGVTTLVLGNCGNSAFPLSEFFTRLSQKGISPNAASLIGHGTVRKQVMAGSFMRPPTGQELNRMRRLVQQAMEDGAVGLSTGLIYIPGVFAKTEELISLAEVAAAYDGVYASHMRDEGLEIDQALAELFRIARQAGLPAHVSHIKLSSQAAWGGADRVLSLIEAARAEGLDITQDQYLYTASSTGISQLIPEEARQAGSAHFTQLLADPAQKTQIIEQMKQKIARRGADDYAYAVVASFKPDPSVNGLNIRQIAERWHQNPSLENQIEVILDIQNRGGATGIFHGISEEDLQRFLQHPNTLFASDSAVREFQAGVPHPRGYGNAARALHRYTHDLNLIRLEETVRRLTSLPATVFRLKKRGLLQEGFYADITIFDPAAVRDHATFSTPHRYATGFHHVLVNGVEVIRQDQHTAARPGRILRRNQQ